MNIILNGYIWFQCIDMPLFLVVLFLDDINSFPLSTIVN